MTDNTSGKQTKPEIKWIFTPFRMLMFFIGGMFAQMSMHHTVAQGFLTAGVLTIVCATIATTAQWLFSLRRTGDK